VSRDPAERDGWVISRRGSSAAIETQFALADGILGVRAGLEEWRSPTAGAYMASVFEQTPIHYHERLPGFAERSDTRVPIADGTRIDLNVGGCVLGERGTQLESCDWHLDLKLGVVRRVAVWAVDARRLEIISERVMPGRPGASLALRYTVRSIDFEGGLQLASRLDVSSRNAREGDDPRIGVNLAGGGLRAVAEGVRGDCSFTVQQTARSDLWVAAAQAHRWSGTTCMPRSGDAAGIRGTTSAWTMQPGESVVLEKCLAYASGRGQIEAAELDGLCARTDDMAREPFDIHVTRREAELDAQWRTADIRIVGDDAADRAIRFNVFHLLQSASLDPRYSTAAKGLTGEGYEGHAFWDTEAFVVPALVFTAPRLARIALEARIAQLDGARATARQMNHARGALYPWRTIAGRECSAHYPSGSAQYHINAAIAQAVELFVTATDDETILLDGGAELLWETARLWLDVGTYSPAHDGKFCILGVTGPDEYSALVDNNFYTNRMAALHLQYAAECYRDLSRRHPEAWEAIRRKIQLDEREPEAWRAAADAMHLPYDARLDIDAQDERFLARPRLPQAADGSGPLLLSLHPLTLYRHQISKQADLVLAMVFAGEGMPVDRFRRNLAYYESVTTHDSTLSSCAYSIASARAGMPGKALSYFRKAAFVDIDDLHGNVAHGSHMASLAGSVMAVQWGFAGLTWRGGTLGFAPVLPDDWRAVVFRLLWQGRLIEVEIEASATTYRLLEGEPLRFRHRGTTQLLTGTCVCRDTLDRVT